MLVGKINQNYKIVKCVKLNTVEAIVLAERNDHEAYVTWLACDPNLTGVFAYYHGHYYYNWLDAIEDFWLRVKHEVDFELSRIAEGKRFD